MRTPPRRHPAVLGTVIAAVALLAALGAAAGVAAFTDDSPEPRRIDASLRITPEDQAAEPLIDGDPSGERVPDSRYPKLGGGLASLADYRGTPVVLNFFGSWCVPCRKEVPDLQALHEELGDRVAIVGLAVNDSERDASAFVARHGVTYDTGRDPNGKLATALGVVNFPSTFFISAEGRVIGARPGATERDVLRKLIDEHLLSS